MDVVPCRENSAIKNVAFALRFEKAFSKEDFLALKQAHNGNEDDLPNIEEQSSISFQINPVSGTEEVHSQDLAGIIFQHLNPNGMHNKKFSVNNNIAVFETTNYTQWAQSWEKSKKIFDRFVPCLSNNNMLVAVGLAYVNEFLILKPDSDWMNQLLSEETKYLALDVYRNCDFWHSHIDFLANDDSSDTKKMLTNIDLDCIRDQSDQKHKVVSLVHHRIDLIEKIDFLSFRKEHIDQFFFEMHKLNKQIILDILTDKMAESIGLKL